MSPASAKPPGSVQAHRRRAGIAVALSGITVVAAAAVTWAAATDNLVPTNNYTVGCLTGMSGGTVCRTDNADVTYYMDSGGSDKLEDIDKANVRVAIQEFHDKTDLKVSYDSSPSWSGDSETDIYYAEATVPGSDEGLTWCNDNSPGSFKCDQQYVRIEGGGHYSPGLSCHETGHAVGLLHGADASPRLPNQDSRLGCMKKTPGFADGLGTNNRDNIDANY
ncbi:hypothetical protein [Streptomyces sp. HM190]|uniref:hypothetical protein n=1 Tax=Streptomyces sp. HM190 TaxID=2695266 RepID=UPI001F46242D|nr:hypothetical protein [Streptomyces sp. HM190]